MHKGKVILFVILTTLIQVIYSNGMIDKLCSLYTAVSQPKVIYPYYTMENYIAIKKEVSRKYKVSEDLLEKVLKAIEGDSEKLTLLLEGKYEKNN